MSLISICTLAASSRASSDWRFWVFFAILCVLWWVHDSWWRKNRGRALQHTAKAIGFVWQSSISGIAPGITLLETGFLRLISNVMLGQRAGCEVTLFDCEYETEGMKWTITHSQTVAAFCSSHVTLPVFQFGPEPTMRKIFTVGSTEQFKYETRLSGVRSAVGNYILRSTDAAAANTLFNSELLQSFSGVGLEAQAWFVEANQKCLVVCQPDVLIPPELYEQFLQQTSQIAANVFGYAWDKPRCQRVTGAVAAPSG